MNDNKQEKWYEKYHRISRDFFNGDYEKTNREAREAIGQMKNESMRSLELEADFYLIGIDASIKEVNPDRDLIEESERIASNDPAILLRSLMVDIHDFELNRLNDIIHVEVMRNIEEKGNEAEAKIHERFRDNSDICMMKENLEYLEQCYSRYMELCRKKKVPSNLIERNVEICKKEGFFGNFENERDGWR
jgi:hypothetical protein